MSELTLVTTCMGRLDHLKQVMPGRMLLKNCDHVVVDWSCPENCGAWLRENFPQVRVVSVPGQAYFISPKAKNAGVRAAVTEKVLLLDVDMLVVPGLEDSVLSVMVPGTFAVCGAAKGLSGAIAFFKSDWEKLGGCDETLEGYCPDDSMMCVSFRVMGLKPVKYDWTFLSHIKHSNLQRGARLVPGDRAARNAANMWKLHQKRYGLS